MTQCITASYAIAHERSRVASWHLGGLGLYRAIVHACLFALRVPVYPAQRRAFSQYSMNLKFPAHVVQFESPWCCLVTYPPRKAHKYNYERIARRTITR